jgi:hypothetical protein
MDHVLTWGTAWQEELDVDTDSECNWAEMCVHVLYRE